MDEQMQAPVPTPGLSSPTPTDGIVNGDTTVNGNGTASQNGAQAGPSTFNEYASMLEQEEDESKFQKEGPNMANMLEHELQTIKQGSRAGTTRLCDYQIEAVLAVRDHYRVPLAVDQERYLPALITAPPGSGKSGMVTLLPFVLSSKKVLILTPSIVISSQLAAAFAYPDATKSFFYKTGMVQNPKALKKILETPLVVRSADEVNVMAYHNLVIINVQKLSGKSTNSLTSETPGVVEKMKQNLAEFDTVIVDEAHHYPAQTWVKIIDLFRGKKVVFLTATPYRRIGSEVRHMKEFCELVEVYNISKEKLEGTTIRKLEFIQQPSSYTDCVDAEFVEDQLKKDIDDLLAKHKQMEPRLNPQALITVRYKNDALTLAALIGGDAVAITSGKVGEKNLQAFTKGEKKIGIVCTMLREGYDNPNITLCVILQNCQSTVFFEQFCGRCMRMNRELTGRHPDKIIGTVLSYEPYQQQKMWDAREYISNTDPIEENTADNDD